MKRNQESMHRKQRSAVTSKTRTYGRDFHIKPGEAFLLYQVFNSGYLPEPLLETDLLTNTEKICMTKLNQFSGQNGQCYPSLRTLAKSIKISMRQVNRVINALVEKGFLIKRAPSNRQKGQHRSTRYYHAWHPIYDDAVVNNPPQRLILPPENEEEKMSVEDRDDSPGHFCHVIHTGSPCRTGDESALDNGDGEAFVTGGTRTRSYEIKNFKVDHKKENPPPHDTKSGMGKSPGFPIPPLESGPPLTETAFEKEKAALLARYTPAQQHTIRGNQQ
ncbi:MAG: helix-turn-helix domain-containing protein [Thermodesulfobacteriota bacterium]